MIGEDGATVFAALAECRKRRGCSAGADAEFEAPTREQYERQGSPYYSTARLWDDGIIEPAQTRDVVGLALDVVMRSPVEPTPAPGFGVFRM